MKLVLHKSCVPVKGHSRSLICDLRRHQIKFIPNSLFEILSNYQGKTIEEIKAIYKNEYDETIDEYFAFLVEHEFVFFSQHIEMFKALNTSYSNSAPVTNAVIDCSERNESSIQKIISQLTELRCLAIQFRFFESFSMINLIETLEFIKKIESTITSIECLVKYNDAIKETKFLDVLKLYPRLMKIVIYNAKEDKVTISDFNDNAAVIYSKKDINSEKNCGVIHRNYFSINMSTYTESVNHNSCLHRKISIDREGNIKNCPSMQQIFGNIKDTKLQEALEHQNFKKYWNITKDQIEVCKDCEFRYICTDCRAYKESPENDYAKPLKCGYNPYTNEWTEWSINPLKQNAIEYYGMQELVKTND
ncbi:SPASM domain peptide maturase, grasp-with-spasm system [Kordia sp. SMS9]|uniref:grasp-with-spasm system SPASM domain peptide maturase n=1 Tax=Kordia sp. SMS9 TaxID=2282170 RepID=UPI000E0DD564|nr:grasp-with-spasm system SPASM domain peptide maturase [Kordia sp. SMS9]AXG71506.1 SPASM domain peptide maturase, grasp-with-spasm system [Kordia sp. SMS9]